MNQRLKYLIKEVFALNDYGSFKTIYKECTNYKKFIRYRLFPKFKKNKYWPIHPNSEVRGRVIIGKGARVGHRPNCIIQGRGKVFIGDYVGIGPNCVIISGNHDVYNQSEVVRKETIIGDNCWLASSCIILAGVVLGPRTIVGAGSVVTKSFPEGYCVIAGNPAKVVRYINKDDFKCEHPKVEYYGYIRADKFPAYYNKYLSHIKFDYDLSKVTSNSFFYE